MCGCHRRRHTLKVTNGGRDVAPQSGTVTAAGAANSAAVPSADDLAGDETEQQNGDTIIDSVMRDPGTDDMTGAPRGLSP